MNTVDLSDTLPAGSLLVIEQGEYSDFSTAAPVRMLRDATKRALVQEYVTQYTPENGTWYNAEPDPDSFLPWMVRAGYVEAVDHVNTWHVGSYGRFHP
jgi:hypothetical protein